MMAPPSTKALLCISRNDARRFLPIWSGHPLGASDDNQILTPLWRPLQRRRTINASMTAQHWRLWRRGNINFTTSAQQTAPTMTAQPTTTHLILQTKCPGVTLLPLLPLLPEERDTLKHLLPEEGDPVNKMEQHPILWSRWARFQTDHWMILCYQ